MESNPLESREIELPPEICKEIGNLVNNRLDIAHFRSVCKTWRSSLPRPSRFPLLVLPPFCHDSDYYDFYITERKYYAVNTKGLFGQANRMVVLKEGIKLFFGQNEGIKLGAVEGEEDFMLSAFLPVMSYPEQKVTTDDSQFMFLGSFYSLQVAKKHHYQFEKCSSLSKIVFIFSNSACLDPNYASKSDITVVARLASGRISFLRLGNGLYHQPLDLHWEKISTCYEDFISYKGKLYTVDIRGRAFEMEYHTLKTTQVASPLFPIFKSYSRVTITLKLVKGLGELFLVTQMFGFYLKVYKLIPDLHAWHEVKELGDQVLLLFGHDCFSVPSHVFADSKLMDLNCECCGISSKPHMAVFSTPIQTTETNSGGYGSRLCVVPINPTRLRLMKDGDLVF